MRLLEPWQRVGPTLQDHGDVYRFELLIGSSASMDMRRPDIGPTR